MFDLNAYRERCSELHLSGEKLQEVISMTEQAKKKSARRPLRVGLVAAALCALLLSAALRAIPAELTDTAADLGAGPWACFWRVRLPLLRPAFGGCLLVSLLGSFRVFREAFLLGGAHPDNALYGLQHFLYNNFANMNYPRLAAASVLLILITAGPGLGVLAALRRSLEGRKP